MRGPLLVFAGTFLVAAAVAAVWSYSSLEKGRHAARAGWALRPVVVVTAALPAGAVLGLEQVSQRSLPEQFVVPEMVTPVRVEELVGRVVTAPLAAGDPVLWTDLTDRAHLAALKRCTAQVKPSVDAAGTQAAEAAAARLEVPSDAPGEHAEPPEPHGDATGEMMVVVAQEDLPEGTVLKPGHLATRKWPRALVTASLVSAEDGKHLIGRQVLFAVQKGDAVLWQMLDVPDAPATVAGCVAAADKAVAEARATEASRAARAWTWPEPADPPEQAP